MRYDPAEGREPHLETYQVDTEPGDRVLDLLLRVKWYQDGTLTFRRSCGQGICGSDAMLINFRNRLACKLLVKELGPTIDVRPLPTLRVIRDLVVDLEPFFQHYAELMPWLVNHEPPPDGKERRQSPEERLRFDDTTKCILCAACTTACPPFWANHRFVGPAAIVNAHRFIFDSRDRAGSERLDLLNRRFGAWGCRLVFNCTEVCPRGIQITNAIEECKRAIAEEKI
jgi:succinate dehydrogenase / fumarate reductase iron-sulfur subunit